MNSIRYVEYKYTHIRMEFESYGGDDYYSDIFFYKVPHKAMIWLQKIYDRAQVI